MGANSCVGAHTVDRVALILMLAPRDELHRANTYSIRPYMRGYVRCAPMWFHARADTRSTRSTSNALDSSAGPR